MPVCGGNPLRLKNAAARWRLPLAPRALRIDGRWTCRRADPGRQANTLRAEWFLFSREDFSTSSLCGLQPVTWAQIRCVLLYFLCLLYSFMSPPVLTDSFLPGTPCTTP